MVIKAITRNSSIELLKIFAIIMIVFSHAMITKSSGVTSDYVMNLEMATTSIQRIIIVIFKYGGQLGNNIFLICSAWFLIDSKKVKLHKVIYLISDCFLVSVIFLGVFLICGYDLSFKEIIKQFFPTWMSFNWFIGCYLMIYIVHPVLNLIIKMINKEKLLIINIMIIIYFCFNILRTGSFFFSNFIGFIGVYFIVAYMKLYLKNISQNIKVNIVALIMAIFGNLFLIGITDFLGLRVGFFSNRLTLWNAFINPFLIITALAMFNLARRHQYINKGVNYIASLSMLIYIIHENNLIRTYLKRDVFQYIYETYSYHYELLWVIIVALTLLTFGVLMAIIYKSTLQKLLHRQCDFVYEKIKPVCKRFIDYLLYFD